ncbi:hypothetical protein TNCV_1549021 [Trichonephila clavipes]|nr:hypothetical protein TNCV_1549021 [Trichonephila clavipes]
MTTTGRDRNLDGNRCTRLRGFQMLKDDEIVTSVQAESDPVDDKTDEDEANYNESSKDPSNAGAFSALETAMEGQIVEVYGEEAMSRKHVAKWCRSFQSGRKDVKNREWQERPAKLFNDRDRPARNEERIQNCSIFPVSEVEEALIW